jgi:23S rRNA (cytosine1962-C5)-methyltransferase
MRPIENRPSKPSPRRTPAVSSSSTERQEPLAVEPTAELPSVQLRSPTRQTLIYRKRVATVERARSGDMVAVYAGDELLGYGLFNSRSEIAVRMLSFGPNLPDDAFWNSRLQTAVALRRDLLRLDAVTNAYRLIHAEADGLTGMVVDRLGDVLSAEAFSLGMYRRATAIVERLASMCGVRHTLVRPSPQFLSQEGCEPPPLASPDLPDQVTIEEFGTRFRVRFAGGHKTGFFCDQRDNRRQLAAMCEGRSVLDLCCYTGGFSVQAKRLGKAAEVTGVDLDEEPLKLARENANLNQARVRFVQADAFAYMRDMIEQQRQYDVVVLDPPKLVRSRLELEEGTRKHFDLNRLAMRLVRPGGLLLSCCCSGLLQTEDFHRLLISASRQAGAELPTTDPTAKPWHAARSLQILAKTGAAADHPIAGDVPETEYLKAVWMRIGD